MDVLCLPCRRQGAERRSDVAGPHQYVPGHLHRARPAQREAHRDAGAGADGSVRAEAAHDAPAAHPRVQRAVRGRPQLGHRVHRRHGRGRPHAGHQKLLPRAQHALHAAARARAQPDRAVERAAARVLQALLREGIHRHRLHTVRERRPDAPALWRRLRHRLLRFRRQDRQADAVLRRALQHGQDAADGAQRRPRRKVRRPDRPAGARDRPRRAGLRRGARAL